MSKADEYLGYARQCQQLADETQSLADKQRWRKIAESWLRQADGPQESSPRRGRNSDQHQNS